MLRSRIAWRSPSRDSSIPARSTRTRTPRVATTEREAPGCSVGFGSMTPRTEGPRRIPASTSPINGDWPTCSIASPATRAATNRMRRARTRSKADLRGTTQPVQRYLAVRRQLSRTEGVASHTASREAPPRDWGVRAPLLRTLFPRTDGRTNPRRSLSRDHVHDALPDVHRVVGDPFQIPAHEDVPRSDLCVELPRLHPPNNLLERLLVQEVDGVVLLLDVPH